ncbi:MAG: isopentenyl phosphate kinase family protein [Flexilinea sp.]|nr:isopentenyl phosphate kinase family protein [Flexilinea sp.]
MITFLKLGGSLITDKNSPHTARPDVIRRLAEEICSAWNQSKGTLLIGHGSGSFGHVPAKKYGTRQGVRTDAEWNGFAEVHAQATALNHIVTDILREAGLPILSFVPMNCVRAENGKVICWDITEIKNCIDRHLIPLIFGDTVFDSCLGGTILSTEDLFTYLCEKFLEPPRILLAGLETGVWKDFPSNTELISEISSQHSEDNSYIHGSASTDVTGGMHEKVRLMQELISQGKADSALIFSGELPGNVQRALEGQRIGTAILK